MNSNRTPKKYFNGISNSTFKIATSIIILGYCISMSSCKKFLDVSLPKDRIVSSAVFSDDQSAISAMTGTYSDMMQTTKIFSAYSTWYLGLGADELSVPSNAASQLPYLRNEIAVDNTDIATGWSQAYLYIYDANSVIEGLNASSGVSLATKNQLIGEAKVTRAFVYFNLVNLFGDVPLVKTTNYKENSILPRAPKAEVYSFIIQDLKESQSLLTANYPSTDRARPNKWTAAALLSRVYLYTGDWANAEIQASAVINSGLYSMSTLPNTFLKTSNETIWQLMPVNPSYNTLVATRFVPANNTTAPLYALTTDLVNSFEIGDERKINWVGTSTAAGISYNYPFKYKIRAGSSPLNEYFIVFRLAEQYLIRAEARAKIGTDLPGAIGDTNVIRTRAGLPNLSATLNAAQILDDIEKERRIEFFTEWGHRWFDLKRTSRIDAVLTTYKPTTWKSTASLWPIPLTQINANPFLVPNPGYN